MIGLGTGIFDGVKIGALSCWGNMLGLVISQGNGPKLKFFMDVHIEFSSGEGSKQGSRRGDRAARASL